MHEDRRVSQPAPRDLRLVGQPAAAPKRPSLRALAADVETALEDVDVPAYVLDRFGYIRWLNHAAEDIVGDRRGQRFTDVVAAADMSRASAAFARNIVGGTGAKDVAVDVLSRRGEPIRVEVSSVPLRRGTKVVGVFGLAPVGKHTARPRNVHPHLTSRQSEVLNRLAIGRSTEEIAAELHVSIATVRSHVRRLLRTLGAHSRLEAVAIARADGLLG
jgi:DNA-binding CsgD family transcriptional regulator